MAKEKRELTLAEIEAEEAALTDFQFAIIDAMNEGGISQAELAKRLGVSRARITQLLSSEANPTLKLVGRALAALSLRSEYLPAQKSGSLTRHEDFWDGWIKEVSAFHSEIHALTPVQVDIFKAKIRISPWEPSEPANENSVVAHTRCASVA